MGVAGFEQMHLETRELAQQTEIPSFRIVLKQFTRLFRMIRPYWGSLLKGTVLAFFLGMIGMVTPYLTKLLIDEVYPARDVTLMHVVVGGVLAVAVVSTIMGGLRVYYATYVNSLLSNATSLMFFNHLQHLKVRFFDEHRVGEIMSRFNDVGVALNAVSGVLHVIFVRGVHLVLVPPLLFLLHWKLAVVALLSVPVTVTITFFSGRVQRKYWTRSSEAFADFGAFQLEVFSHIRTFKAMALESYVYKRAKRQIEMALRLQLTAGGIGQIFGSTTSLMRALNTALFTWFAWTLILSNELTIGEYVAFMAYIGFVYNPLTELVSLFSEVQRSAVHLGRMFEYLDSPAEQDPSLAQSEPLPFARLLTGRIQIRDVRFGYAAVQAVLQDLSVDFPAGKITAIVGPSGAGKSTLLRLLTRLETPVAGGIFLGGESIADISLPDLRKQVTAVWQEVTPISGTILENLTLGCDNVEPSRVQDAIRVCRLETLISDLQDGLQTTVGEWGATLSGGQRQRLAIAHALIRDTPVLLLDEVTSNIDVNTEAEVLEDLFSRLLGKTVIFVTHRVATAHLADHIVVLDGGRVVATGTHRELSIGCGLYQAMLHPTTEPDEQHLLQALPRSRTGR